MSEIDFNGAGVTGRSDEIFSQNLHCDSTRMSPGSGQSPSCRHNVAPVQIEPGQVLFASFGRVFLELAQRREANPEGRTVIAVDHPETDCQMLGLKLWPGFFVESERHSHYPAAPMRMDDRGDPVSPQDDSQERDGLLVLVEED